MTCKSNAIGPYFQKNKTDIRMPRQQPQRRDQYQVFYPLQTRWIDNDQYGHMNNIVHYSLIDTAVTNWQYEQNLFDTSGDEIRFLVVESGCIYHAEAGYPDLIHAGIRLGHIGTSSWRYEVGLFRNEQQTAFADGFFAQVQVEAKTNTPLPLSEEFREKLNILS